MRRVKVLGSSNDCDDYEGWLHGFVASPYPTSDGEVEIRVLAIIEKDIGIFMLEPLCNLMSKGPGKDETS